MTQNSQPQNDPLSSKSSETLASTTSSSEPSAESNSVSLVLKKSDEKTTSAALGPSSNGRDEAGRFLQGHSLPAPKGDKQLINKIKRKVELSLREQAAESLPYILQKAIDLAVRGDRGMIKMLLELSMSRPAAQDDDPSTGKDRVTINIRDLTLKPPESKVVNVIDGDYEET